MAVDLAELAKAALIGELEKLRDEVRKLAEPLSDVELWKKPLEESNSIGHLILHLTGNLNHFVGARLGHTGGVHGDGPADARGVVCRTGRRGGDVSASGR